MLENRVEAWMSPYVVTVDPETPLTDADYLMQLHRAHHLPVLEGGALVGLVTQADLRTANPGPTAPASLWGLVQHLSTLRVRDVMKLHPVTIRADATLGSAARALLDHSLSGLPVVDAEGRLAGIFTESDIFRAVATHWGDVPA